MALKDHPEFLESLISGIDGDTGLRSRKIAIWKCVNPQHEEIQPREWDEACCARVKYRYCPKCSLISREKGKCIECDTLAYFNYEGESAGAFCAMHKKEKMINVKSKKCAEEGCLIAPSCGYVGQKALYCATHKKDGMANVVTRKCAKEGCLIIPAYAYEGQRT